MPNLYSFEEEKRRNYYDWRKRQNIIGPIESYESYQSRKVKANKTVHNNAAVKKKLLSPKKYPTKFLEL